MAYFQTKNTDLGKFWRVLQWKVLVYYMPIWSIIWLFEYILWPFGILRFMFSRFGMFPQEKYGNPASFLWTADILWQTFELPTWIGTVALCPPNRDSKKI
jgi:hypothetical protein